MSRKTTGEQLQTPLHRTLRTFIGYNIKRTYVMLRESVLEVLNPHQLRPTSFSALVIIADNSGLSQSQLANALEIKRSGVVLIVDELEQAELITRDKVPGDRRSYALRATLKGMQKKQQVVDELQQREQSFFSALSTQESELLTQLFSKLDQQVDTESQQAIHP